MWQSLQNGVFILDNPQLEFSVLNPNGPFLLLNPCNKLCSGETQTLVLSFTPQESVLVSAVLLPLDPHTSGPWCGLC